MGEASQLWSFADIHEANGNLVSKNAAFDKPASFLRRSGSYTRPISLEGAMSHVKSMLGDLRIAWTA